MNPHSDLISDQLKLAMADQTEGESPEFDPEQMLEQLLADPAMVQHVVRTRSDGSETIVGYFRCDFSAGEQRHVLHVPFSPPLVRVPTVNSMAVDSENVRVRVTDRQKFGVRLEVVLPSPSGSEKKILVEVIASSEVGT